MRVAGLLATALMLAGAPPAEARMARGPLDTAWLLDFCKSPTVAAADRKGKTLGWPPIDAARKEQWRAAFVASLGGSVEAVGWRNGESEDADNLGFWVSTGLNAFRACTYSTRERSFTIAELAKRFGPWKNRTETKLSRYASWKKGGMEVSFSSVGSSASVQITFRN